MELQEEAIEKLEQILSDEYPGDAEDQHIEADGILVELLIKLGYKKVVEKWFLVPKWYS